MSEGKVPDQILTTSILLKIQLCSFGTLRLISRISDAPAEVVDGGFEDHFTERQPPTPRTLGAAVRALDA